MKGITWIRRVLLKNRILVLFVPLKRKGVRDAVRQFVLRFAGHGRRYPMRMVLSENCSHFSEVVKDAGLRHPPDTVVLFAHPASKRNGFAVNRSTSIPGDSLLLRWWRIDGDARPYRMIAHVCRGGEILRRQQWQKAFPEWISFSRDLKIFLGTHGAESYWQRIMEGTITIPVFSESLDAFKLRLEILYRQVMVDLYDNFDRTQGDALTLMYMQHALESIVTSEEQG